MIKGERFLSAYSGRRLLGNIKITRREKQRPRVAAMDANGKPLGRFTSQRAAFAAIDSASEAVR